MFNFLLVNYVILLLNVLSTHGQISDKRLCANQDCTAPISLAKTLLRYGSPDKRILSFAPNEEATIYSKSAGTRPDLWGAEIKGKRGYVPKTYVREYKVFTSNTSFLVDVEDIKLEVPSNGKEKPVADSVQKPYEIIDGTTIYLNDDGPSTESAVPVSPVTESTEPLQAVKQEKNGPAEVAQDYKTEEVEDEDSEVEEEDEEEDGAIEDDEDDDEEEKTVDEGNAKQTVKVNNNDEQNIVDQEDVKENKDKLELKDEGKGSNIENLDKSILAKAKSDDTSSLKIDENVSSASLETKSQEEDSIKIDNTTPLPEFEIPTPNIDVVEVTTLPSVEKNRDNLEFGQADDNISINIEKEAIKGDKNEMSSTEETVKAKAEETQLPLEVNVSDIPENLKDQAKPQEVIEKIEEVKLNAEDGKRLDVINQNDIKEEISQNTVNENIDTTENFENYFQPKDINNSEENKLTLSQEDIENNSKEIELSVELSDSQENAEGDGFKSSEIPPSTDTAQQGMFSGFMSNLFGNSEPEEVAVPDSTSLDKNGVIQEQNNLVESLLPEQTHNAVQEQATSEELNDTKSVELTPLEQNQDPNIVKSDELIPSEQNHSIMQEPTATEQNPNVFQEQNEPSARDILWSSSIRKDIDEKTGKHKHDFDSLISKSYKDEMSCAADSSTDCPSEPESPQEDSLFTSFEFPTVTYETLSVLVIAAMTIVVFLWGYVYIDKNRKEVPLVAKINNLQKEYLITKKENELLTEKLTQIESDASEQYENNELIQNLREELVQAQNLHVSLEEQIQVLEKELENSTEVGLELNRMLSEFLSSENGSDTLVANVEQLQRQLIEQQTTINTYNDNLNIKETENHELKLELEIGNTKVTDLQSELNKMAVNLLKTEEDKEQIQGNLEAEINSLKEQLSNNSQASQARSTELTEHLRSATQKLEQAQRNLDIKTNEYILLKESLKHKQDDVNSLLEISSIKAELIQLQKEKEVLDSKLRQEVESKRQLQMQIQAALEENKTLKIKYDEADRDKTEAQTKLEVLSNYFKEKEAGLQKELNKQESMWIEKEGEATSTIQRIKYMQEELQNYKVQNESLKQEILAQEVQLKSQISVLEKRAHENWMGARQAERKLEDAKQEAAQLRNRLTMRERNLDEKNHNRLQSPLEQNGELPISPMHLPNETPASPLLYGTREHMTTSPPLPGLPPFLPPPPGVPFMPPPLGGVVPPIPPPGFLPPPPSMISGDHRPPPLGRMSSPPLNSRYSPDSRAYSPYSRNSPSATSDEDDERSSPPYRMGYGAYIERRDDRREFSRNLPPSRSNRNNKGGGRSSGSANSNESIEKINRHNSNV